MYDLKINSEDERKNFNVKNKRHEEYVNYVGVETGVNQYIGNRKQEINNLKMNKTYNKEENELHVINSVRYTNRRNKTMMNKTHNKEEKKLHNMNSAMDTNRKNKTMISRTQNKEINESHDVNSAIYTDRMDKTMRKGKPIMKMNVSRKCNQI